MAPHNRMSGNSDDSDDDDSCSSHQVVPGEKRRGSKRNMESLDKDSEEYRKRRERNNLAVKKSRTKTKQKTMETLQRVSQLRAENEMLESKIKLLTKELSFLKDLFLAHAGSAHGQNLSDVDLSMLSEEGALTPITSSAAAPSAPTASSTGSASTSHKKQADRHSNDHVYAVKVETVSLV